MSYRIRAIYKNTGNEVFASTKKYKTKKEAKKTSKILGPRFKKGRIVKT